MVTKIGPATAAKVVIERIVVAAPPVKIAELLCEICISEGWNLDPDEAMERAEQLTPGVSRILRNKLDAAVQEGRFAGFRFNTSASYMVQGAAFVEPDDDLKLQAAKAGLSRFGDFRIAMANLSPRDFEAACVRVLVHLGVREPTLTPYRADEGIDFHGQIEMERFLNTTLVSPGVEKQLRVWLVGQAKHFPAGKVSTFHLRELVGSVELARGAAFGSRGPEYISPQLRVCDPVFFMFFTTGEISRDAWNLIRRSGVIGMDGFMLAALVAEATPTTGLGPSEDLQAWIRESTFS